MNPVHFSSKTDMHTTPQDFFDALNSEFGFVLDVAATDGNAKCDYYFTAKTDGLKEDWAAFTEVTGSVWCNPPYGRVIGQWVAKAATEAAKGATVVCLLPARTDTRWWHGYIQDRPGVEVRFVKGRLKFGDAKSSAPFPSAVVIFRPPEAK